jgi:hypothetical protein
VAARHGCRLDHGQLAGGAGGVEVRGKSEEGEAEGNRWATIDRGQMARRR